MKTTRPISLSLALGLFLACGPLEAARAEDPQIPAVSALQRVASTHGDHHVSKIVRMRGKGGQPQPREWWITVYDPAAPYLVHEFWVGDTRATDEGPNLDYYPVQTPPGFIPAQNIKLDSVDAFEVLNREAMKAKVSFDSVNYFLRCREFSEEPIWTLQAVDPRGGSVGFVDLSAQTGKILRMVWLYGDSSEGRKAVRIVDTALLGRSRADVLGAPGSNTVDPGEDPAFTTREFPAVDPLTGQTERMVDPERLAPDVREIRVDEPRLPAPAPPADRDPLPRNPVRVNPNADTEVPEVVPLEPGE